MKQWQKYIDKYHNIIIDEDAMAIEPCISFDRSCDDYRAEGLEMERIPSKQYSSENYGEINP